MGCSAQYSYPPYCTNVDNEKYCSALERAEGIGHNGAYCTDKEPEGIQTEHLNHKCVGLTSGAKVISYQDFAKKANEFTYQGQHRNKHGCLGYGLFLKY